MTEHGRTRDAHGFISISRPPVLDHRHVGFADGRLPQRDTKKSVESV
jgi:hypothetical protein